MTWKSTIVTLFPEMFPGPLESSVTGRALKNNIASINTVNIRNFGIGKHKTVDDTCYGGGAGMLMLADIVDKSLKYALKEHIIGTSSNIPPKIIYLTPKGVPLTQNKVKEISSNSSGCIILCGHYEGIDQRVIDLWKEEHNMEEISIGDYILSGGEVASFVLLDSCIRLLDGTLSNIESKECESFENLLLEFPQYTRPNVWSNRFVPDILLSGNHKSISNWRLEQSELLTKDLRPDLYELYLNKKR